jgi:hypothetical protein
MFGLNERYLARSSRIRIMIAQEPFVFYSVNFLKRYEIGAPERPYADLGDYTGLGGSRLKVLHQHFL